MTTSPNPLALPVPASLAEVREAVNAIDRDIALALARRAFYVREAVRFKRELDDPETLARRASIIAKAVATAQPLGAPAAVVTAVYEAMLTEFRVLQGEVQNESRSSFRPG